jgi:cytochrome d ubiquinol oxidase subunit II
MMQTWFGLDPVVAAGGVMLLAITAYAVLAGADFGGGIWDLLARGPRREEHRQAIARAMGPVWEANHVWLIFVNVILFSVFPPAYRALGVAFFGLFHLVLVGIVLRGAAFAFRSGAPADSRQWRLWSPVFGAASTITPFLLGVAVSAISGGGIRVRPGGEVVVDPALTWFSPVSLLMGLLTVALCAYLAAVFLTVETGGEVREDFRRRSLWAGGVMAVLAAALLPLLPTAMPHLWDHLTRPVSAFPLVVGVGLALLSAAAVHTRRYRLARVAAVGEVIVLLGGWAFGQWPYLIYPDVTAQSAAAPGPAFHFLLNTLPVGLAILLPSLWLLYRVFKAEVS